MLTFIYGIGDKVLTQADIGRSLNTILINQSEEEHTHFEDRFINLTNILVDFRNCWYEEYLLQLGEYFKYKNEKG